MSRPWLFISIYGPQHELTLLEELHDLGGEALAQRLVRSVDEALRWGTVGVRQIKCSRDGDPHLVYVTAEGRGFLEAYLESVKANTQEERQHGTAFQGPCTADIISILMGRPADSSKAH